MLPVRDGHIPNVAAVKRFTSVRMFTGKEGGKKGGNGVKRKEAHREIEGTKAKEAQADEGRRAKKRINVNPSASNDGNLGSGSSGQTPATCHGR
jgi:hypothetical protein